ncbi:MAG: hypothetical protein JXR41_11215 [Bacteroidales bacterium]|nr:hypothetical protein [Bacteroidales bacterium]MBN2763650.1 hypothetical protein [Bacteroidales bacterium]
MNCSLHISHSCFFPLWLFAGYDQEQDEEQNENENEEIHPDGINRAGMRIVK